MCQIDPTPSEDKSSIPTATTITTTTAAATAAGTKPSTSSATQAKSAAMRLPQSKNSTPKTGKKVGSSLLSSTPTPGSSKRTRSTRRASSAGPSNSGSAAVTTKKGKGKMPQGPLGQKKVPQKKPPSAVVHSRKRCLEPNPAAAPPRKKVMTANTGGRGQAVVHRLSKKSVAGVDKDLSLVGEKIAAISQFSMKSDAVAVAVGGLDKGLLSFGSKLSTSVSTAISTASCSTSNYVTEESRGCHSEAHSVPVSPSCVAASVEFLASSAPQSPVGVGEDTTLFTWSKQLLSDGLPSLITAPDEGPGVVVSLTGHGTSFTAPPYVGPGVVGTSAHAVKGPVTSALAKRRGVHVTVTSAPTAKGPGVHNIAVTSDTPAARGPGVMSMKMSVPPAATRSHDDQGIEIPDKWTRCVHINYVAAVL